MKLGPSITIVGSADEDSSAFDPPLANIADCRRAAREIGEALARRACQLVVYTADPSYIEYHVVQGYLAATTSNPRRVTLRLAEEDRANEGLPEEWKEWLKSGLISPEADKDTDWEVGFFRALDSTDGVVLIGGRKFGFLAGLVVMGRRLPIVPVATLGGAARKVWQKLDPAAPGSLVTQVDVNKMREPEWSDASAERTVNLLLEQCKRARALSSQSKRTVKATRNQNLGRVALPLIYLLAAIASLVIGLALLSLGANPTLYYASLVVPPALAGLAGAASRGLTVPRSQSRPAEYAVVGGVSGVAASMLFIASQLTTNDALLDPSGESALDQGRRLLIFAWIVGLLAGVTFDAVYAKLQRSDVARTEVVDAASSGSQGRTGAAGTNSTL
jgi:hypothetical protein